MGCRGMVYRWGWRGYRRLCDDVGGVVCGVPVFGSGGKVVGGWVQVLERVREG